MNNRKLMLGNEAIALGLIENGCKIATSYPGTPASEILSSVAKIQQAENLQMHTQWAINEKVAFEIAYTACITGLRSAVSMKQVGLNVASDPLMSAAYMGTNGGFIVISADDPGPHSSQTEQDSRLMAMMAKIPVLDPDCPSMAKAMISIAYAMSEEFEIPVMLRPTTRVCHTRQDVLICGLLDIDRKPKFEKDPARWAATPKFRFKLHTELEKKLTALSAYSPTSPLRLNPQATSSKCVIASGVAAAHCKEIMQELGLWEKIPFYQVLQPYPLHTEFISEILNSYDEILVIEETMPVIEMQIADRNKVRGKSANIVPKVGELLPETIEDIICKFAGLESTAVSLPTVPGRRPTLCAGCPHRASFFAIRKAAPKAIYTGDIGCYTLGLNLGAVDTVLCMGAAISQAAGFYHAHKHEAKRPDIVATIGDSTFFHAGIPALIDAVVQGVKFVLVILDNRTTAMTGNQPTPASGFGACGESLESVEIMPIVQGCGVKFCKQGDPYKVDEFTAILKEAVKFSKENGPAVVIAKHPCLLDRRHQEKTERVVLEITDNCDGCGFCVRHFECPALVLNEAEKRTHIDTMLCCGCGVCLSVCPKNSINISPH
ncbi:MAG TPA: indolepyruvate oxidoreductase [Desulfobacteraceae bacterium]|nr:indolepyruvate oxidoreductase [Desulfobacteraceae bacterium]